jgi:hypothetical protein
MKPKQYWFSVRQRTRFTVGLLATCLATSSAHADSFQATGKISSVLVSAPDNSSFRVTLQANGVDPLTGCLYDFAFINTSDGNYQAKVATLLSAQSQKQTVALTISRDASNWCTIGDINSITN